jgi:hypothetical protein
VRSPATAAIQVVQPPSYRHRRHHRGRFTKRWQFSLSQARSCQRVKQLPGRLDMAFLVAGTIVRAFESLLETARSVGVRCGPDTQLR